MAEIALRLQPAAPGYVDSVMRLAWGTLLMSLWIELAVRRQRGEAVDVETLAQVLTNPSPGKVVALVRRLAGPETSWSLVANHDDFIPLTTLTTPSGRAPTRVIDAIDSIVQVRNAWAHHKLVIEPLKHAEAVEKAVRRLLETHALLGRSRLIYTHRVERLGTSEQYNAIALQGVAARPFRKGQSERAPQGLAQGHVCLRDETTGMLIDLHPFVLFDVRDKERCLVLNELKPQGGKVRPLWFRILDGSVGEPNPELDAALDAALPGLFASHAEQGATQVDVTPPTASYAAPQAAFPSTDHVPGVVQAAPRMAAHAMPTPVPGTAHRALSGGSETRLAAFVVMAALVTACVLGSATALLASLASSPAASVASTSSPAPVLRYCDLGVPMAPSLNTMPQWLTGVDIRWTESTATFAGRCGAYPGDTTACTILEGRRLMPATGSGLPGVAAASAAFDARADGGMFEITIQSTSPVAAVESAFTTAFGRPTEVTGARRFWTLDNIRVSLSPARQSLGERFGFQSTFVARFRPQSDVFYRDRGALCP